MKVKSQSFYYLCAFSLAICLLAVANFLQIFRGVNPCPLCILQRLVLGLLAIIFIISIISWKKKGMRISLNLGALLVSMLGIFLSGRQVWLQHFPSQAGANCEVSLQYMLRALPLDQVAQKVLTGSSACSQVGWELFHLSLAQWSLISFILFALFSLWQLIRR